MLSVALIGIHKKNRNIHRKKAVSESLFTKVPFMHACLFIKKRLRHRCFPVKLLKFLRTSFLKE